MLFNSVSPLSCLRKARQDDASRQPGTRGTELNYGKKEFIDRNPRRLIITSFGMMLFNSIVIAVSKGRYVGSVVWLTDERIYSFLLERLCEGIVFRLA